MDKYDKIAIKTIILFIGYFYFGAIYCYFGGLMAVNAGAIVASLGAFMVYLYKKKDLIK